MYSEKKKDRKKEKVTQQKTKNKKGSHSRTGAEYHFGACKGINEGTPCKVSDSLGIFELHVVLGNEQCKESLHDGGRVKPTGASTPLVVSVGPVVSD